jgi:hypothetical protein
MHGLTDTETRLVEDYLWVIDLISRCAQGLDGGDWYYLADKAQDLARRASGWPIPPARSPRTCGTTGQGRGPGGRPCAPRWPCTAATTAPAGCCTPSQRSPDAQNHDLCRRP